MTGVTMKTESTSSNGRTPCGLRRVIAPFISPGPLAAALLACLATASHGQPAEPAVKATYVRLTNNSNALLKEPAQASRNERIVLINTHPDHLNTFEYFAGRQMVARGYRVIEINYYGPERTFEEFLTPIAAAVRYARTIPGVEKVVLMGHSGGGPELSYYQEIAENGPSACQEPNRLYPCDPKGLTGLPKADAVMLLEANIGAPHRMYSLDPAVDSSKPAARDPALDMYAPQNGFDPETDTAKYSDAFVKRFNAAQHVRSEKLIADAKAKLAAIGNHTGPFKDDEPMVIPGMAENSLGARLNLPDGNVMSQTHAAHMELMRDGSAPVHVVHSVRKPAATPVANRDTLGETSQNTTIRHYLSFLALKTTPDFALTRDMMKGIDWRSSANSAPGNVEKINVPTLVMAGSCTIHLVPLEMVFDHAAAKDKEFVVVEGGNHNFGPCRPEFGDSEKRAFDYADAWLNKRF
jgi:pimeloyl-ACP methyl ester carboxylesterase